MRTVRHPDFGEAVVLLKAAGWSDSRVANAFGLCLTTVARFRQREGIGKATGDRAIIDHDAALQMWREGASDGQISRKIGITQGSITRWRQRNQLEPNFERYALTPPDIQRQVRQMVKAGASRRQITEELPVKNATITRMRRKMSDPYMRATGVTDRSLRLRISKDRNVLPQIEQAIGKSLPADVRHDAATEMYMHVLSGRLDRALIEEQAPKFRSRAFEINYGRYSDTSLDTDRGGWTLGDMIEDEDALAFADGFDSDD